MNPDVDNEIEAIKVVLAALQPLAPEVREVVLDYVLKRLGMKAHHLQERLTPLIEKKSTTLERGEQHHAREWCRLTMLDSLGSIYRFGIPKFTHNPPPISIFQ
jgi:hypothetical protein